MTLEELEIWIAKVVQAQLQTYSKPVLNRQELRELFEAIDRDRWTPAPGSPSTTELLREDRNR